MTHNFVAVYKSFLTSGDVWTTLGYEQNNQRVVDWTGNEYITAWYIHFHRLGQENQLRQTFSQRIRLRQLA